MEERVGKGMGVGIMGNTRVSGLADGGGDYIKTASPRENINMTPHPRVDIHAMTSSGVLESAAEKSEH